MPGKIGGMHSQIFQPAPVVSSTVYGQPDSNPGFAPFPPASLKRPNGQVSQFMSPTGSGAASDVVEEPDTDTESPEQQ
jgi:hypothetical protein